MNRRDYRAAFDAVDFSADFEERTLQKLAAVRQASEKEQIIMPMNRVKKTALLIAAAVALLAVSVSAAVVWLTPAQVADRVEEPLLAELIGMDRANLRSMYRICGGDFADKMHLLMDFTNRPGEVADPWYTGDFDTTWRDVEEGCPGLLQKIIHNEV